MRLRTDEDEESFSRQPVTAAGVDVFDVNPLQPPRTADLTDSAAGSHTDKRLSIDALNQVPRHRGVQIRSANDDCH